MAAALALHYLKFSLLHRMAAHQDDSGTARLASVQCKVGTRHASTYDKHRLSARYARALNVN
eukprot:scaffold853_cov386-Prasinococcus_capsulatus_cf.AAC.7